MSNQHVQRKIRAFLDRQAVKCTSEGDRQVLFAFPLHRYNGRTDLRVSTCLGRGRASDLCHKVNNMSFGLSLSICAVNSIESVSFVVEEASRSTVEVKKAVEDSQDAHCDR